VIGKSTTTSPFVVASAIAGIAMSAATAVAAVYAHQRSVSLLHTTSRKTESPIAAVTQAIASGIHVLRATEAAVPINGAATSAAPPP
jgi:hypothetical protein